MSQPPALVSLTHADCGSINGLFFHVSVVHSVPFLSCWHLWVLHSGDSRSVPVLCSCIFAHNPVCVPAWGRAWSGFVLVLGGAELCHHLQCCILGCSVPACGRWGLLAGPRWQQGLTEMGHSQGRSEWISAGMDVHRPSQQPFLYLSR